VRLSISKEDYLKVIAEAESEGESVTSATLVRWLDVSAPAASMALKRLRRDHLVEVDRGGSIRLTSDGRQIADRLLRRHHLLERMLVEVFDFEWYKVHDEAERLEHAISDDFETKLRERLGDSAPCPHGNRLGRETPETRRARGWLLLSESPAGAPVTIRSVYERDRALLEHLERLGLRPGVTLVVQARNWDDTLRLSVAGMEVILGLRAAGLIWAEPL
jgi:DtxR family Mn-dependent transcriptional regulator